MMPNVDPAQRDPWRPRGAEPPPQLPGYRDFSEITRGGTSCVYRAFQEALHRPVAVKVLQPGDPDSPARFRREIEITIRLGRQHPNIVKVLDTATTADGRPCIIMDLYDQGSLRDRLRAHGPLPVNEVFEAGIVVADALSFAHRQGVLHRDIKPQNILVLPTSYVVADFGIARPIDLSQHTASIDWFTFQHASPQVVDGQLPTAADDIWSLGSTLFMLLDGRPPFGSEEPAQDAPLVYMRRVRGGERRALRRPDVPAALVEVIERCLQPERDDRYPDATALREALREASQAERGWASAGAGPQAPPEPAVRAVAGERRRWPRVVVGLAFTLGVAAAIGVGGPLLARELSRPGDASPPSPSPTVSNVNNPKVAPSLTEVTFQNGQIRLRWQDPTNGQATFIVVQVMNGRGNPVRSVPAGVTEVFLDDTGDRPYCYLVIAAVGPQRGVSATRCADQPS
jgi:serine/threonine protein kinase